MLESGDFEIGVGASSRDLRLTTTVTVDAPAPPRPLGLDSPVAEWLAHPEGGPVLLRALNAMEHSAVATNPEILRMVESLPLNRLIAMSGGRLDTTGLGPLLDGTHS